MGRLPGLAESNARIIQGRNRSLYQIRLTPGISLSCRKKGVWRRRGWKNIFCRFHLGDSRGLEWITCQRDASLIVMQWRIFLKVQLESFCYLAISQAKKSKIFSFYTLEKQRLKITQLEKVCFIKMNELKLTQVELF